MQISDLHASYSGQLNFATDVSSTIILVQRAIDIFVLRSQFSELHCKASIPSFSAFPMMRADLYVNMSVKRAKNASSEDQNQLSHKIYVNMGQKTIGNIAIFNCVGHRHFFHAKKEQFVGLFSFSFRSRHGVANTFYFCVLPLL